MWSQSCLLRTLGLDIDGSEILLFAWYTVEILWKHSGFSLKHIAIAFILLDLPLNQEYSRKTPVSFDCSNMAA